MVEPIDRAANGPSWIVCMGATRALVEGVVVCPLGTLSSSASCLACHFLEGSEGDRRMERSCSVGPDASSAELIIELL